MQATTTEGAAVLPRGPLEAEDYESPILSCCLKSGPVIRPKIILSARQYDALYEAFRDRHGLCMAGEWMRDYFLKADSIPIDKQGNLLLKSRQRRRAVR